MTDLNARLDTISESLAIASGPTQDTTAGYIEWQDAVSHLLDATPALVSALRAVLEILDKSPSWENPANDIYTAITAALGTA